MDIEIINELKEVNGTLKEILELLQRQEPTRILISKERLQEVSEKIIKDARTQSGGDS